MTTHNDDIAIVGMAALFSKAPDVRAYWQNIVDGVCCISDHPSPEARRYLDPSSKEFNRIYTIRGAYLGELAAFDPLEFGVMPDSLEGIEPDHFLALKVARDALEDAGFGAKADFPRERTDVILGHGTYINPSNVNWLQHGLVLDQTLDVLRDARPDLSEIELAAIERKLRACLPPITAAHVPGLIPNVIAGRIANRLDLKGVSYIVDAACASSLVAVSHGVNNLLLGKSDVALVGGVQACMLPQDIMTFCRIGALSKQDALRPFDHKADGTLFGEGCGVAVLMRRKDAEARGMKVYACIKGYGLASDGRSSGLLAPRLEGEILAISRGYEMAGFDPTTVGMLEAHATGIPLGDATEIKAYKAVFGEPGKRGAYCAVGSVKSMIGHCVPAAGIGSMIKASLALHHKVLPPTANFEQPHPELGIENSAFYINHVTRPWVHGGPHPRRAGVSAMGFGGINSHVVLEEYA